MDFSLTHLYLLSGLVLHKAVWEILKVRDGHVRRAPNTTLRSRVLSASKIVILAAIVVQIFAPEFAPISDAPMLLRMVGLAIYTAGLIMAVVARFELGRNWSDIEKSRVQQSHRLVANGMYRWVRHPIYTGDLLLLLGLELALNSWAVLGVVAIALYVRRQAAVEERALMKTVAGYEEYCRHTPRFFPFWWAGLEQGPPRSRSAPA
jgi:protein-S-isoprenylcysteine O-methyltransferase Ste14